MKVEIPEFLLEIAERMRVQDNRCTAEPVFVVQVLEDRICNIDYDEPEAWVIYTDDGDSDFVERIPAKNFKCDELPCDQKAVPVVGFWVDKQWCLTELAAEEYIKRNRHNLGQTRIYCDSLYRNEEMIKLRKWILSLAEKDTILFKTLQG